MISFVPLALPTSAAAPVSLLRTTRSSQVSGPIGSERLRRAVVAKGQQTRKLLLLLPQALLYVVLHNVVHSMYSVVKILGLQSSLVRAHRLNLEHVIH